MRSFPKTRAWIGALLWCLWGGGLALSAADEVHVVFSPGAGRITAGQIAIVRAHWFNSTGAETTALPPLNIHGQLRQGGASHPVTLKIASPYQTAGVRIGPGEFLQRDYSLPMPAGVAGRAVLELDFADANLVAMDVAPGEPGVAASGGVSAAADKESGRLALDQSGGQAVHASDALAYFQRHFAPHEPMYFMVGADSPNAKFQISFKYQLITDDGWLLQRASWLSNFYAGYTQVSLWDWNKPSAPFFDSSYKPELLYATHVLRRDQPDSWVKLDLQGGLQHESNGRDGASSRSINFFYLRPYFTLGQEGKLNLTLIPKMFWYVGDLSDNPDIDNYRGHLELRSILGWDDSLQLSAVTRIGDSFRHGSVQVDATYPMWNLPVLKTSVFLDLQYFTGYGESLLLYNQRSWALRAGFSLSR